MKWLAVLFVIVLALLIAAPIGASIDEATAARQAQHQAELDRRRWEDELARQRALATLPGEVAANYVWQTLAVIAAGGLLFGLADAYRRRQARTDLDRALIAADARGLLPVPRQQLLLGAVGPDLVTLLALYQQQAIERARHQPGQTPGVLHYTQSITHPPAQLTADAAPPILPDSAPLPGITDLAAVLGAFQPGLDRVLLGLGPGGSPITVGIKQLCHVALVGATGGGKSNLLRLLLPQLQALGARIVLADPHYAPIDPESGEDWRGIAARLHLPPAVHPETIAELLAWLTEELDRRLILRRNGQHPGRPLFLAFDELPVIVESVAGSIDAISKILREGRKVNLLTVGASQDMLVKTIGGSSAVRDCYRTAFYVGGDVISAARLLDLPQRAIDDGQLALGLALVRSTATTPAQVVRVPYASNAAIAQLLDVSPASDPTSDPPSGGTSTRPATGGGGSGREVGAEVGTAPPLPLQQDAPNPRAARVRELLRQKATQNEIIEQLWGVTGGRAYQQAAEEFRAIVAGLVGGAA